ncbi:MAG: response regulator [Proteobacteria bacterium]|nr:response regulator [Pseudomonadota bacterium]
MVKRVLIVDDDLEMLVSLKEGLSRYNETFSVLTAGNGVMAVDLLKENAISLVVTDLKMPKMDGFSLLAYIMESYPEIPVIIITGYSTPEMERLAREGGAVGYIAKPFMIADLAKKIMGTLRRESDGGTLHNVSSGMFLQLMEMEEKTCTIRLVEKSSGKQGILFFLEGELLDARANGLRGASAAYEIFSWEEVSLSIQNACHQKERRIHGDLQAILLEAMRLKDERERSEMEVLPKKEEKKERRSEAEQKEKTNPVDRVKRLLGKELAKGYGVEDIYQDDSWEDLVKGIEKMAKWLNAGEFNVGYIDSGEANDFILVPGDKVTVISVNPKCPRDRLINALKG